MTGSKIDLPAEACIHSYLRCHEMRRLLNANQVQAQVAEPLAANQEAATNACIFEQLCEHGK